jgi:hypothetical protein
MNFTTAFLIKAYSKLSNGILCLLAIGLLVSCNKPEDGILKTNTGNNLLNLQQTDTISLDMVTEHVPYLANSANLSADILGTFTDPVFGRTTAGVYSQVRIGPTAPSPVWTKTSSLDSVVLTLKLSPQTIQLDTNGVIGKKSFSGQTWHIYKMASGFGAGTGGSSSYPSDTSFHTSMEIGKGLVSFRANDSILRLSIKGSSVNSIFRDSLFDSTGNSSLFTDQTEFDQLMHGIYIMPDSVLAPSAGNGTLAAFNLADTNSRVSIYYDAGKAWYMTMYSSAIAATRINVFNHNYSNSDAWKHVGLAGKNVDRVYIQAMGGMSCIVKVPYLGNLIKDKMIVVNKAEFIFPVLDSAADLYSGKKPYKIIFRPRRSDGKDSLYLFDDDVVDYYQQTYRPYDNTYKYLMTKYIQKLIFNYRNKPQLKSYGINLSIPPDNPNEPGRVLLYTQHAGKQNRPKLIITYTKIVDK